MKELSSPKAKIKKARYYYFFVIWSGLFLFLIMSENQILVQAADTNTCVSQLNKAEESYYNGQFDEALQLSRQCLQNTSLTPENRLRAYTILARTFLGKNETDSSKWAINRILELNPDYQPTIEQEKPQYVHLVTEIKIERAYAEQKKGKKGINKWIWIGAGTVASAAIITLLTSGNSGSKETTKNTLGEPPPFPE
jgi:hypothetical protein